MKEKFKQQIYATYKTGFLPKARSDRSNVSNLVLWLGSSILQTSFLLMLKVLASWFSLGFSPALPTRLKL